MFKEKNNKKRIPLTESSKGQTLDARHKSMLDTFEEQTNEWQRLKQRHTDLENQRTEWKQRIQTILRETTDVDAADTGIKQEYQEAWSSNLELTDQIIALERRLNGLQFVQQEIQYFEHTGRILFEYYDLIEKHQNDDYEEPITLPVFHPSRGVSVSNGTGGGVTGKHGSKSKSILEAFQDYFQTQHPPDSGNPADSGVSCEDGDGSVSTPAPILDPTAAPTTATGSEVTDKRTLVEQYMSIVEPSYLRPQYQEPQVEQCPYCSIPLTYLVQDGITICNGCGFQELILVEQNKSIYRQPTKETSHLSYKRINHFNEWISQIQAKESTDIPEEIYEKIIAEIKKEKIRDMSKITARKMRYILKKIQSTKYYEHLNYILGRIINQSAPSFSPELEEKLRSMFKEIQTPFIKHCPKNRKNFLSYSYVLYKFFQLLEKDEYLRFFPLLKNREKLHVQDQIWKNICAELNWQYIESI